MAKAAPKKSAEKAPVIKEAKKSAVVETPVEVQEEVEAVEEDVVEEDVETDDEIVEDAEDADEAPAVEVIDDLLDALRAKSSYLPADAKSAEFVDQSAKEDDKSFCLRIFEAVTKLTDDAYNSLLPATQEWLTTAMDAASHAQDFELPGGFVSKFGGAAKKADAGKADAKPKADKPAKAPAAPKAPPAPKEQKAPGVVSILRRIIVENSGLDSKAIKELPEVKKLAAKDSTFNAVFTDTHATLRIVRDTNHWK